MRHSDCPCTLALSGFDGKDSSSDRLCHVGTGVDGNDDEGRTPHSEVYAENLAHAVIDEGCLKHHRCSPEYFNIGSKYEFYSFQKASFENA